MKSVVIVFPGSNCDRDLAVAIRLITGNAPTMVWHRETELPEGVDLIAVPGGFSYGDYLRSGAMAARSPIMRAVVEAAERGVFILGICNGFQILTEAGLLPGALMRNAGISFVCRDVPLDFIRQMRWSAFQLRIMMAIISPNPKRLRGSKAMAGWHFVTQHPLMAQPIISPGCSIMQAMCLA
jgi:phosphoribosylformylglycinamidine synthase I